MNTPHFTRALLAATLSLSLVAIIKLSFTPGVAVEAQTTLCGGPKLNSEVSYIGKLDPYWPKGTPVQVFFKLNDFTPTQRGTMKQAFEAWDIRRFNNCSGVIFFGYTESSAQPRAADVGAYAWVIKQESSARSDSLDADSVAPQGEETLWHRFESRRPVSIGQVKQAAATPCPFEAEALT